MTKKDLETHVICTQMIKRGILDESEMLERQKLIDKIESDPDFFSEENTALRYRISKSMVKRRNAVYKEAVDVGLKDRAADFERYVYHVLSHYGSVDPRVLTLNLNI